MEPSIAASDAPAALKCDLCDKNFESKRYLGQHKRWHHQDQDKVIKPPAPDYTDVANLTCKLCSRVFNLICGLKSHMRSHDLE